MVFVGEEVVGVEGLLLIRLRVGGGSHAVAVVAAGEDDIAGACHVPSLMLLRQGKS